MADVVCPRCRSYVPLGVANTGRPFPCGGCRSPVILDVFPAAFRGVPADLGTTASSDVSTCFFHEARAAQTACDGCGRYICALCDIPLGREHLCPECLAIRNRKDGKHTLPNERVVWDRVALGLAVGGLLLWPVTLVTAPAALFVVIRYWNKPGSLVRRGRVRFVVAGLLAAVQTAGWIYGAVQLFSL